MPPDRPNILYRSTCCSAVKQALKPMTAKEPRRIKKPTRKTEHTTDSYTVKLMSLRRRPLPSRPPARPQPIIITFSGSISYNSQLYNELRERSLSRFRRYYLVALLCCLSSRFAMCGLPNWERRVCGGYELLAVGFNSTTSSNLSDS